MSRWTVGAAAVLATVLLVGAGGAAQALDGYPASGSVGVDISYPSCHTKIPAGTPFGVVGVSGGRVFEDNACAAKEAAAFPGRVSFYVNTGLYTAGNYFTTAMQEGGCAAGDLRCGTIQYAQDAADHAVAYAVAQKLPIAGTTWWLDVETTNTWDADTTLNTLFITTEHDRLVADLPGSTIGVYAVPSQWAAIVGAGWDPANAYDVWYANGLRNLTATTARRYCTPTQPVITGGPVVLVQWVAKIDQDLAC